MSTGTLGTFYGIGVGPGPAKLLPLAAWEALQEADVILVPRAKQIMRSTAKECLAGLDIPDQRFREVIYNMDPDRIEVSEHYHKIALSIADDLRQGKTVAYLTIGDSLTYSTYSYTLEAVLKILPDVPHRTFPGVTSYAAAAAALEWPLGQGKERILILPCPDQPDDLRREIETHDIVVLMKIGRRLPAVITVIKEMGIADHCAFASKLGLEGEVISHSLEQLSDDQSLGYLTTMLIRKTPNKTTTGVLAK